MQRTLLAPFAVRMPWRRIAVAVYVGVNLALIVSTVEPEGPNYDWDLWQALGHRPMYEPGTLAPFVWSPVAGWIMALVPTAIGYWPWAALHLAAVALLRDWRLMGLVLVSWPFWGDVVGGNTFTFVFVSGALALRGSRWAGLAYLGLLFLMPRPVQIPLAVWLLWKRPDLRWPTLGIFVAHGLAVLSSGLAGDWISAMLEHTQPIGHMGPTRYIGLWWLIGGLPLAVWLAAKGRVGWAGLAMSPYWLPQYLLMPLAEIRPVRLLSPGQPANRDPGVDGDAQPNGHGGMRPCPANDATGPVDGGGERP